MQFTAPHAMRTRRETVEHPFGMIKARMGAAPASLSKSAGR